MLVMALQTSRTDRLQAGQDWLLSCCPSPTRVARAWAAEELARIPIGVRWLVAEGPLLRSVAAMKRVGAERLGPVLADVFSERVWWLLPPDVGDELDDVHQLTVRPSGWLLACPPVLYPIDGCLWLERPDGSGRLTDPIALGAAFGPGGGPRLPAEAFG